MHGCTRAGRLKNLHRQRGPCCALLRLCFVFSRVYARARVRSHATSNERCVANNTEYFTVTKGHGSRVYGSQRIDKGEFLRSL